MGSRLADRKKLFLHPAGTQVKDPQNIGLSPKIHYLVGSGIGPQQVFEVIKKSTINSPL